MIIWLKKIRLRDSIIGWLCLVCYVMKEIFCEAGFNEFPDSEFGYLKKFTVCLVTLLGS